MFIRTARRQDIAAIRDLLAETWHATYDAIYGVERVNAITAKWHSADAVAGRIEQPRSEFIVADDGSRLAGVAFATAADEGKTLFLHQLYVRPGMQGRGIGGLLLDEIETAFPEADRMRLEVEEANTKAVGFYVAQGFVEAGRTDHCGEKGSGIPALVFERAIAWAD